MLQVKQVGETIKTLRAGLDDIDNNGKRYVFDELDLNKALLQLFFATGNADEVDATLKRIEPLVHRITSLPSSSFPPVPIRRRLGEDLEVAKARLQLLEGHTAEALPVLKRMASSITEGADPDSNLAER